MEKLLRGTVLISSDIDRVGIEVEFSIPEDFEVCGLQVWEFAWEREEWKRLHDGEVLTD